MSQHPEHGFTTESSQINSKNTSKSEPELEEESLVPTELGHFPAHFSTPLQFWKPYLCNWDLRNTNKALEYITENFCPSKISNNLWVFPNLASDFIYWYTYIEDHIFTLLQWHIQKLIINQNAHQQQHYELSPIHFLVKHYYTWPSMNTCVAKWAYHGLFDKPPTNHIKDNCHLHTLPEALKWLYDTVVVVNQATKYTLQYLEPELVENWRREKREKAMRVARVEFLVKMKKKLQYVHKFSVNNDGTVGIRWWEPHGPLAKEDRAVKKEPISLDPNNFQWGPQEIWYP